MLAHIHSKASSSPNFRAEKHNMNSRSGPFFIGTLQDMNAVVVVVVVVGWQWCYVCCI